MTLKTTLLFTISFLSLMTMRAQYSPLFTEDFSSNTHQWKASEKKPYLALLHDEYHIYNDEGKQPVVSAVDVPFKENMSYKIEARLKQSYTPDQDGGRFGIFFGGSDEKNGYVFALSGYGTYTILKMTNGKVNELNGGSCNTLDENSAFYKGEKITLLLESINWQFLVNDSMVYSCLPIPFLGNKTGFYVSPFAGMIVTEGFTVYESAPMNINPCPLSFTQEEFSTALETLICHADDDFVEETGEEGEGVTDYLIWEVKNDSFPGAVDIFLSKAEDKNSDKKGKDMVLMFQCEESANLPFANIYFENLRMIIDQIDPECTDLKPAAILVNVRDDLLKATTWEGDIATDKGKVRVRVELDINLINEKCYVVLHINLLK